MAITVKHKFVSAIPDGTDTTIVRPSNWNDDHDLTGTIPVANGGTGASTLTGYVKGNGTSAMTANTTIPNTDITGLGTMSTQNANAVAVTGGTVNGTTIGATTASTGAFTYLSTSGSTSTTPVLTYNASNCNIALGGTIASSYLQTVMQNKSGTAGASTNFAVSNDLGTDSTYYGEFGMNSSVFSSGTPSDFFSINNGIYFSGHDGDVTIGSGNGYKTYLAWGTTGQSAHVINATGAIGLNTSITGSTNFGTSGQVLTSAGSGTTPTWTTPTTGTVTSVTGTAPVASSGGATPAISMAAANTTTNGYLTSTDWNTFNGKGSGTVTSVGGTGTVNGITLTGTVTSSGSLTLGGTLSGIGNSQLTNSTISGVSLGSNLFALTAGTNITFSSGTTYNGSAAITINATGGMTYPSGTGIAVVTGGSAWGTTLTAPSGTIVGTTDTQTLTNKRINLRVLSQTSTASLAINSDNYDQAVLTAQAVSLAVPAPTGTPVNGQKLTVRIKDNSGAQTISWTTTSGGWRVMGVTLPTTTVASKVVYVGAIYNSDETFWDVVSVAQQA